ncbi:platelet-activating factor acetylhydrolase IB subunit alpha1 isoform X3 [Antechinus flavipes]|uniref:platelet-activating factor acetylhydrolase IB subunit alpha1 isoform X3 n=1 Tax=Antechinus flavipes TaxID=38775 RepID=UPI0022354E53|nr:platelet-activating factor acetylhydrolase IB subunit alpha1 isoform X3 [Antechinus flavipes]
MTRSRNRRRRDERRLQPGQHPDPGPGRAGRWALDVPAPPLRGGQQGQGARGGLHRGLPGAAAAPVRALAGTLLSSARAQLWDRWGQHSARAVEAGEWGAGAHPSQDRGGLGGDQQPRAHGRAGGGWNRGHRGPGEPAAAPGKSGRAGPAAEGPAPQPTEGQEPPRQRAGASGPGGPAPGSLPGRGPRLCALGRHHQPPRHV